MRTGAGTHNHRRFYVIEMFATSTTQNPGVTEFGFRLEAGTTLSVSKRGSETQASPSVSNIAALMASGAVLPAHTTNWNAG